MLKPKAWVALRTFCLFLLHKIVGVARLRHKRYMIPFLDVFSPDDASFVKLKAALDWEMGDLKARMMERWNGGMTEKAENHP